MKQLFRLSAFLLLVQALPQQAQQNPQTGSIEGIVVRFGTEEAIPRAKVTLRPSNSANSQAITADDGGRFAFRNLAAGQYRVQVTRDGYVPSEYGQRSPSGNGVAITLAAQQQFKEARLTMTPSGTISGRILNRYGEPAANVNVQALRYTYQEGRRSLTPFQTIATNDLGEYRLFFMPPGQYIVSAQPGNSLGLDPGGTVFVQTTRGAGAGAAIAGGLGGQLGANAVTRITVAAPNTADVVAGLAGPGGLVPPPPSPPPPPGVVTDDSNLFLPVYYPGTTDVTAASPVDLRAGGNVGGVNLTVVEAKPVRIRGQVLNGGRPAPGAQVSIYQRNNPNGSLTVRSAAVNNETGVFEFRNLAPGPYELIASMNGGGPQTLVSATPFVNDGGPNALTFVRGGRVPGMPVLGARSQVDVLNADIDGVSLQLENGFNVNGRISREGQSANNDAGLGNLRLQLQSDPAIPVLSIPPVSPEADGAFTVPGVTPGLYRLSVSGLPRNAYLKAARLGGVDMLNGGLRIDADPGGPLEIVLGAAPASLDVAVMDDRQAPAPAVTVALVPEATQQKRYDLYRSATTDAQGRIHLDGVVPGEYKVYAWESVESGAWTDPDFMKAYASNGITARVSEGGRVNVDVRVIPYKLN